MDGYRVLELKSLIANGDDVLITSEEAKALMEAARLLIEVSVWLPSGVKQQTRKWVSDNNLSGI